MCSCCCSWQSSRVAGSCGWPAARHVSGGGGGPAANPSDASSDPSACRTRPARNTSKNHNGGSRPGAGYSDAVLTTTLGWNLMAMLRCTARQGKEQAEHVLHPTGISKKGNYITDAHPPCGSKADSGSCPIRVASARCSRSATNARASRSSAGGAAAIDPGPPWQICHRAARHSATRATCHRHRTAEPSCCFMY